MTDMEVVEWMRLLAEQVNMRKLPFDFSGRDMTDEEHKVLVGLSKEDFTTLLGFCGNMRNSTQRSKSNALQLKSKCVGNPLQYDQPICSE
jgi:hypothetical protein